MPQYIIRDYKVNALPLVGVPNARYYVPNGTGTNLDEYVTDLNGNFRKVESNSISGIDELIKISSNDTTADYLINKINSTATITVTENNNSLNEYITLDVGVGAEDNAQTDIVVWDGTQFLTRDVSTISGSTPTLQQVFDVESQYAVLNAQNTIDTGGFAFNFSNSNGLFVDSYLDVNTMYVGTGTSFSGTVYLGKNLTSTKNTNTQTVVIGLGALGSANGVTSNIAIGSYTLSANINRSNQIAIGDQALSSFTTGANNIVIGHQAGIYLNNITGNTLFGYQVAANNLGANYNTAFGYQALLGSAFPAAAIGALNSAFGHQSGYSITTGEQNAFFGMNSGWLNTSGSKNTFLGTAAGENNTNGGFNTYVGHDSAFAGTTGNNRNVAIGWLALPAAFTNLLETIAIGYDAGIFVTSGSNNVFLGALTGNNASQKVNPANQILLGHSAWSSTDNTMVLGNTSISTTYIRGAVATAPTYFYGETGTGTLTRRTIAETISDLGITTFTLANGSGTTANGSAVDLGGTLSSDATINTGIYTFELTHTLAVGDTPTNRFEVDLNGSKRVYAIVDDGFNDSTEFTLDPYGCYIYSYATSGGNANLYLNQDNATLSVSISGKSGFVGLDAPSGTNVRNILAVRNASIPYGVAVNTSTNIVKIGQGASINDFEFTGLYVLANKDITFTNYPNTRNDGATTSSLYVDASGNIKYGPITFPAAFTLSNGSGTTASGSAVNLGGTLTADANIVLNGFELDVKTGAYTNFSVNATQIYASIDGVTPGYYTEFVQNQDSFIISTQNATHRGDLYTDVNGSRAWAFISATDTSTYLTRAETLDTGAYLRGSSTGLMVDLKGITVALSGEVSLDTVNNDNAEDKLLTWNSTSKNVEYRTAASIISGTTNYIPKFTSSTTIGDSRIVQNTVVAGGDSVGIDDSATGSTTTNGFLLMIRNSYDGDASASASPMVFIRTNSSATTTQKYFIGSTAPNAPVGTTLSNYFGRSLSSRNVYLQTFGYVGASSTSNYVEDQFFGFPNLVRLYASGNQTIGSSITTDNGYKLQVGGTVKIENTLYLETVANDNTEDKILTWNSTTKNIEYRTVASLPSSGGTVTSFSFTDGNGFDGTVTNASTTPTLSLTTTVTNTQIIYSNSGGLAGDADLTWDSATNTLSTANLTINGSEIHKRTATSADLTLNATHYYVAVDASGANRTITLPTAVGIEGRVYIIKKIDSSTNTVLIDGDGTETLDGAATITLYNQWDWIRVISNNSNWEII